jgi:hypothetical protein
VPRLGSCGSAGRIVATAVRTRCDGRCLPASPGLGRVTGSRTSSAAGTSRRGHRPSGPGASTRPGTRMLDLMDGNLNVRGLPRTPGGLDVTVIQPFRCLLVHPTPRHALGQGRRRAFRPGLGMVMSRVQASWGPWITPPSRCPAAPTLSRLGPARPARGLHDACRPCRRPGRDRETHHRQPPRWLLGGPRSTP